MTNSFHGYVVQANVPFNQNKLDRHLRILKPELMHILNNPSYAAHLKRNVIPDSHIYMRHYDADGDGNDWIQYSPIDYFDKYASETLNGALGLQIANEPGFGRDVTQRGVLFMQEAVKRKQPTAFGGWSVGTPPASPGRWAEHDDYVRIICEHPDLLSYSAHEYFLGLPTSGMVTAATKPGEQLYFTNHLRAIGDWPSNINQLTNMFHVGRVRHFVEYARSKGYGKPAIDITEHGVDDAEGGALKDWRLTLKNGANLRGYKTWDQQWLEWYGMPLEVVYCAMLEWIRNTIYRPLGVRGATLFTWGNSGKAGGSQDWSTFNVETDDDMIAAVETHLANTAPPPPVVIPAPVDPIPPIVIPSQMQVDFTRLIQLDAEAKLLESAIEARKATIEAIEAEIKSDESDLDAIVQQMTVIFDKYHRMDQAS